MALIPRSRFFDIDSFFDDFYTPMRKEGAALGNFFTPRVDIHDNQDHYQITAELPGVAKEDLHLSLEDGVLTIEAETRQEDKEEKAGKIIRQERRYGKYTRSFSIGPGVGESDIDAAFENGVLTVKVPKVNEEVPQRRRIDVK